MTSRQPILIRFSRGTGWEGAVVRWATWSWAAHVGFKLPDGRVLDATPEFGVSTRMAEDDDTTCYYLPDAPQIQVRNAVAYAAQQVGKPDSDHRHGTAPRLAQGGQMVLQWAYRGSDVRGRLRAAE